MSKLTMRSGLTALFAIAAPLLFLACGSAPAEEIAATEAAIQGAQNDDVRTYAPESLKAAEEKLSKAMAEVQAQDNNFVLSRDYAVSSDLLKQAKDAAVQAVADAQANKAKAKADAEAIVAALPILFADAQSALATAPKGKDTKAELEALQADLKSAEEASAAASQAIVQERYTDALAQANTAKSKADTVILQVNAAKEKTKRRG